MSEPLPDPKHEKFALAIVAAGMDPAAAYVFAGFEPHRANHFRLMRHPRVAARISELKQERETAARVARTPLADVLTELGRHGVDRVTDFFENGPAGLVVRDLRAIRVEVALALLNSLREGFGVNETADVSVGSDHSPQ